MKKQFKRIFIVGPSHGDWENAMEYWDICGTNDTKTPLLDIYLKDDYVFIDVKFTKKSAIERAKELGCLRPTIL
jgi:hypothetical protein